MGTKRNATTLRWKNGLAEQKFRAALHAAEFALWQASGAIFSAAVWSNEIKGCCPEPANSFVVSLN